MRKSFKKIRRRIIIKGVSNNSFDEAFRKILTNNLSSEEFVRNNEGLQQFCKVCIETVNNFAPTK